MRIIDNLMALSADKGHSPFPSSERAVCGFALWLVSFLALGVFLMWAFVPDTWLTAIGFSYLPHKSLSPVSIVQPLPATLHPSSQRPGHLPGQQSTLPPSPLL
ncbi:Phosphatidylinositol N-acetylglucosaminyltransferase subunit P [Geodia barretti]|uniref:Phosphatidylinositol N-acetylglucosaminyltransferase subunit P n=1 Tax=Geodia barretti TaxID=519541 RepID=A0AA35RLU4_GEOBA|nr:Phosphatidylinositol N-acetylglucosaminyltransferase subunit P [Geodia barretti]